MRDLGTTKGNAMEMNGMSFERRIASKYNTILVSVTVPLRGLPLRATINIERHTTPTVHLRYIICTHVILYIKRVERIKYEEMRVKYILRLSAYTARQ